MSDQDSLTIIKDMLKEGDESFTWLQVFWLVSELDRLTTERNDSKDIAKLNKTWVEGFDEGFKKGWDDARDAALEEVIAEIQDCIKWTFGDYRKMYSRCLGWIEAMKSKGAE